MAAAGLETEKERGAAQPAVRTLVLARLASTGNTTRADVARDLVPYLPHGGTKEELRRLLDAALAGLARDGHLTAAEGGLTLSASGLAAAAKLLGAPKLPQRWSDIRDTWLVAAALGLHSGAQRHVKALAQPGPLRAAILQKAYNLPIKAGASAARVRSALAVVALERAFGNKIRSGLGRGSGLPAKAGRLLAAHLSANPKDFGTDGRLVAQLAAERAGAARTDVNTLRTAVLRAYAAQSRPPRSAETAVAEDAVRHPPAPSAAGPPERSRPAAALRPDLAGFAREVLTAARMRAEGWPGNRKAYISHVWQAIRTAHPEWALSEIEFKGMLAEAHRTGHVVLANADLKNKRALTELQESALVYKNTVLHFVRVAD